MFLLEHHGKELLASHGVPVPPGMFVPPRGDTSAAALPSGPWMVKAQVAAGGRGKAGAVQAAASPQEVARIIAALDGTKVKGKPIHGFRIEQRVDFAQEAYLSFSIPSPVTAEIAMNGSIAHRTAARRTEAETRSSQPYIGACHSAIATSA